MANIRHLFPRLLLLQHRRDLLFPFEPFSASSILFTGFLWSRFVVFSQERSWRVRVP